MDQTVDFEGCRYGLHKQGDPDKKIKKPWRVITNLVGLGKFLNKRCGGDHIHFRASGKELTDAGRYTPAIAKSIVQGVVKGFTHIPRTQLMPDNQEQKEHQELTLHPTYNVLYGIYTSIWAIHRTTASRGPSGSMEAATRPLPRLSHTDAVFAPACAGPRRPCRRG